MTEHYKKEYGTIETNTDYDFVVEKGLAVTSPSVKTFQAYSQPLVLKKGDVPYLWDVNDKKYVDLMAQNLCISVGYNHPLVNSEVKKQMDMLTHSTAMYVHPIPVHFAEELAATFPSDQEWVVHLVNSGAEAVDVAITMARAYTGNIEFIALRTAYHGVQGAAMAATDIHLFHQPVPQYPGIYHVANPNFYRGIFGDATEKYLEEIDRTIASSTPGKVAGFIVEPIQGFGGVIPMPDGYMSGAFERIRAAGGLCIVDEIQTGFTRTGEHYWGFQDHGVTPDIIVLGKGIGNGFPISAVVAKREIVESMADKKWFNTYGSNPMSCAAGRAILRAIEEDQTQQHAKELGAFFKDELRDLQSKYDVIGDVRGMGLMLGVELVKDRTTKQPADEEAGRVVETARKKGVILGKGGELGNMLRINPPLCIQKQDVEFAIGVLDQSFNQL